MLEHLLLLNDASLVSLVMSALLLIIVVVQAWYAMLLPQPCRKCKYDGQ